MTKPGKENFCKLAMGLFVGALMTVGTAHGSAVAKVLPPSNDPMIQACEEQITNEVKAADADATGLQALSRTVADRKEGKTEQEVRGHANVVTREHTDKAISFRCVYDNGKVLSTKWVFDGASGRHRAGTTPVTTKPGPVVTPKPPTVASPVAQGLSIASARYGAGAARRDVSAALRAAISGGRLSMHVSNDTLGGDPAPKQHKDLTVTYLSGGKLHTVTIPEGGQLNIP